MQDLAIKENADAIQLLHLEDWLSKLQEATALFDDLFISRESGNSTKLSGKVKEARQQIQAEFEQLAILVNAYEIVYGATAYAGFVAKVNEAVSYARRQVSRRGAPPKSDETLAAE